MKKQRFPRQFRMCALLLLLLTAMTDCGRITLPVTEPTPDIEKTVYWMIDDATIRISTQIMREVDLKLAEQGIAPMSGQATPAATIPPYAEKTPNVTSIPESLRNKGNEPTAETPIVCVNELKFIEDITIKDKTVVVAGKPFTKTWKIENTGTCEWNETYQIVFASGDQMSAKDSIPLPKGNVVKPGDTIEISVYMTAPERFGSYTGNWLLESPSGQRFGAGKDRNKPIWVKVEVR